MGRIAHVVGARPNFMKAAPVVRALAALGVDQELVHTGQHYDERLSGVFFTELGLPEPTVNLGVGSGSHAQQTAAAMLALERTFDELEPAVVIVYGDVNSTLAAALVAAKAHVPIAHVEAGLRSFDPTMPEEVNRRLTDSMSDLLFTTSPEAVGNLADEGVPVDRIHFVGNPMIDTLLDYIPRVDPNAGATIAGIEPPYGVVTLHRPANVDDLERAQRIVRGLDAASATLPLIVPLHPRGDLSLRHAGLVDGDRLRIIPPLGYLDFLALMASASVVITDSGGIQEESTVLGVPCRTVRPNTERPITVTWGTNALIEPEQIGSAVAAICSNGAAASRPAPPLWDGQAGERIAGILRAYVEDGAAEVAPPPVPVETQTAPSSA